MKKLLSLTTLVIALLALRIGGETTWQQAQQY